MQIKKITHSLLFFSVLLILLLGSTSCGEDHVHAFSEWETLSEATCTSQGLQKRACACGYTEYDMIATIAHTPEIDPAVSATCTTHGRTEGSHCSVCNAVIVSQEQTALLTHTFSEWETVTAATCTSFGLQKRSCACGYSEYETTDAVAHTPEIDPAVSATCTTHGWTEGSHCKNCGTVLVEQKLLLPFDHTYGDAQILSEATCEKDGTKKYACINNGCTHSYEESYSLEALTPDEIYATAQNYTGMICYYNQHGILIGEASAFLISADGKLLTNNWLLDNAFSATFEINETFYDVTHVLAYSQKNNLAVLKIDATDLPFAKICSGKPSFAETVYTVGVPNSLELSISAGIISHNNHLVDDISYIQHDADMTSGYLGGPLLNRFGEVIAVNIGYLHGDSTLNLSVSISELQNLSYDKPMTIQEYGALTYTPSEQIDDWIQRFFTSASSSVLSYSVDGSSFSYSLNYNKETQYSYVEGYWDMGTQQLLVRVYLDAIEGEYAYYACFMASGNKNETYGYIDPATYNEETLLTYDTFHGRYWTEADLMDLYSTAVYKTMEWFSHYLDMYFESLTLESFGFTSLHFDRAEDALEKLNAFVQANGTYDETDGSYLLLVSDQQNGATIQIGICYTPANGDIPASTVAMIMYVVSGRSVYTVSLTLDPTENGNRFDASYEAYDGQGYVIQNQAWGYLEADTFFTDLSRLSAYVFDGMEDYEDKLLDIYAYYLSQLLEWLDMVMTNVDTTFSIKDLGFLFYWG